MAGSSIPLSSVDISGLLVFMSNHPITSSRDGGFALPGPLAKMKKS